MPLPTSIDDLLKGTLSQGPLPAAQVMALALYHEQWGYYRRAQSPWGFEGKDYYTALDCGPLLGSTLALRLEAAWERLGNPQRFTVLEPGAGRGWLGRDLLNAATGDFRKALHYIHCDNNPAAHAQAEIALAPFGNAVSWVTEEAVPPPFVGAVISNELFDALPAQPWRWTGAHWERACLSLEGPFWEKAPLQEEMAHWFQSHAENELMVGDGSVWVEGWPALLGRLTRCLEKGLFLAVDYGDTATRLLAKGADLRRYHKHQVDGQWWEALGQADLTADVDFTRLTKLCKENGLQAVTTQRLSVWIREHAPLMAWEADWQHLDPKTRTQRMENLLALTLPGMLGERFKVLEGWKGVD